MQFESFYWLSLHGIWAIIPWSTKMVSVSVIFLAFVFIVVYFSMLRASLAIYHLISNARNII